MNNDDRVMNIEQLEHQFGIDGSVRFVMGAGGFPVIEINNGMARASVSVYSAQVLSFQPHNASADLLFQNPVAFYQEGKAIKGGIPLCWPWFGPDPENLGRPAHGFVRTRYWSVAKVGTTQAGDTKISLVLEDSGETRELWPHRFSLELDITVGETLCLSLVTRNAGDQAFSITQALHTYFSVGAIDQLRINGLDGVAYLDKVDNGQQKQQSGAVVIDKAVDRIYTDVSSELLIEDAAFGRRIGITSSGSQTVVVWNPWTEGAAAMADLNNDAYEHFVCVETANAAADVVEIVPGGECCLRAAYRIEQL